MRKLHELYKLLFEVSETNAFICNRIIRMHQTRVITYEEYEKLDSDFQRRRELAVQRFKALDVGMCWWDIDTNGKNMRTEFIKHLIKLSKKEKVLYLKFGCIKGGDFGDSPQAMEIYSKLHLLEDQDAERRVEACKVIDLYNGRIFNWWDSKYVTKKAAKEYIMNYKLES